MKKGRREEKFLFKNFSELYTPQINFFIKIFFEQKRELAEEDFMKKMSEDLKNYLLRPGKRIRPLLLIISFLGYQSGPKKIKEIIKLASVLEIMHAFLLIQDDIIDKAKERRGEKSFHILMQEKYQYLNFNNNLGKDLGLVLSDVLFANALEIINSAKIDLKIKQNFLKIFSVTYEKTAWGQVLDILNSSPRQISLKQEVSKQISLLKTSHYTIFYPLLMGYILSGKKNKSEQEKIKNFSLPLGLAFQIRDDILGVFGDRQKTGKSKDSDLQEGKVTLLIEETLKHLKGKEKNLFFKILIQKNKKKGELKYLKELIVSSQALKKSKEKHQALLQEADQHLDGLRISLAAKKVLRGLLEIVSEM